MPWLGKVECVAYKNPIMSGDKSFILGRKINPIAPGAKRKVADPASLATAPEGVTAYSFESMLALRGNAADVVLPQLPCVKTYVADTTQNSTSVISDELSAALSKLTAHKLANVTAQCVAIIAKESSIATYQAAAQVVYDATLANTMHTSMYLTLCTSLNEALPAVSGEEDSYTFGQALLEHTQGAFFRAMERVSEIDQLDYENQARQVRFRGRASANLAFLGELYNVGIATVESVSYIIFSCLLVNTGSATLMECLARLLTTCGATLAADEGLNAAVTSQGDPMAHLIAVLTTASVSEALPATVRFQLIDALDLRSKARESNVETTSRRARRARGDRYSRVHLVTGIRAPPVIEEPTAPTEVEENDYATQFETSATCLKLINSFVKEFYESLDLKEALACFNEIEEDFKIKSVQVILAILWDCAMGFDKKMIELPASLLVGLADADKLPRGAFKVAFEMVLENLPDAQIDYPQAGARLRSTLELVNSAAKVMAVNPDSLLCLE